MAFSTRVTALRAARSSAEPGLARFEVGTSPPPAPVPEPVPAPVGAMPWARRSRYSSTPRGSIETWPSPSSAQTESVTRSRK